MTANRRERPSGAVTTRPSIHAGRSRARPAVRPLLESGSSGAVVAPTAARAAPPAPRRRVRRPPVQARFDLDAGAASPFPADWLTVPDRAQRTGRRVANPLRVLRSGAVALRRPASSRRAGRLRPRPAPRAPLHGGDRRHERQLAQRVPGPSRRGAARARRAWSGSSGIPTTLTLYARPESLLEPETRYGLVVTRDLRDSAGRPVEPSPGFAALLRSGGGPPLGQEHRAAFGCSAARSSRRGIRADRVAVASVFTTGSVSAFLEQARDALDRRPPAPALMTAPEAGGRAWFPRGTLARLVFRRQVGPAAARAGRRRGAGRRRAARRIPGRRAPARCAAAGRGRRRRDRVVLVALVPDARASGSSRRRPSGLTAAPGVDRPVSVRRRDAGRPAARRGVAARGVRARLRRRDALAAPCSWRAVSRARGSRRWRSRSWAMAAGRRAGSSSASPTGGPRSSGCRAAASIWTGTAASSRRRVWPRSPAALSRRSGSGTACASRWSTSWRSCGPSAAGSTWTATGSPTRGRGPSPTRGTRSAGSTGRSSSPSSRACGWARWRCRAGPCPRSRGSRPCSARASRKRSAAGARRS